MSPGSFEFCFSLVDMVFSFLIGLQVVFFNVILDLLKTKVLHYLIKLIRIVVSSEYRVCPKDRNKQIFTKPENTNPKDQMSRL